MALSGVSISQLVFDPADPNAASHNVGSYVRAGTDGDLISSTLIAGKEGLDVNIIQVDDPTAAKKFALYAEDSAHVTADRGQFVLGVRNDANAVLTDTDGDYSPLAVDSAGRLKIVADFSVTNDFVYPEDSAHANADPGAFVLSVRQDTLVSSVSTDGDYGAFKINDRGALWTVPVGTVADDAVDTENPVKVGSRVRGGALTAVSATGDRADAISDLYRRIYVNNGANIGILQTQVDVDDTAAVELIPAALGGRRNITIQNRGNKSIYVGSATVLAADGIELPPKSAMPLDLGPNVSAYAIATSGTQDVRILEIA